MVALLATGIAKTVPYGCLTEGKLSTYSIAYDDLVEEVRVAHEKVLPHPVRREETKT